MNKELEKILKKFNTIYALVLVALFLVSVFFIALNNYQNKVAIAETIAHIVEENLKSNQLREVMKTLSSARIDEFKAISYYKSDGTRSVTFPPTVDPSYFRNQSFLDSLRYLTFEIDLYFDKKQNVKFGTLRFSINPYKSIPTATLFWALFVVFLLPIARGYKKLIIRNFEQESMASKVTAVREVQRQIKHDSRGAIQAIKAVIDSSKNLDELELCTLKSATKRLEGMIAESRKQNINLVDKKVEVQKEALIHIYTALHDIITEKSALFDQSDIKINFSHNQKALSAYLDIDELHFKRIISNLLDNSIEAINQKKSKNKKIDVTFQAQESNLSIKITDNGIGIKPEHLPNIGTKGYTLKSNGSGLGISWAKERITEWSGDLKVESQHQLGTSISINLPIHKTPFWATDSISIKSIANIVAIDDDPSVVNQWKKKILTGNNIGFFGHESGERLLNKENLPENSIYLIDYDLGKHTMNGLNIASKIENKESIYMVTNNFDDWEVQRFCEDFGVKLIPKTVIPMLEIQKT